MPEYTPHGILRPLREPGRLRRAVSSRRIDRGLLPWEYLFPFTVHNFPDLYTPLWVASLVLLGVLVILYNVRTRALHRHAAYLDLWEWLLWTGLSLFGLLLVAALFASTSSSSS